MEKEINVERIGDIEEEGESKLELLHERRDCRRGLEGIKRKRRRRIRKKMGRRKEEYTIRLISLSALVEDEIERRKES